MKILEIGCGTNKDPNAVGIDANPRSNADVIHDLNVFPYPFESDQFDVVLATSVIEHLNDVIRVMEEIHRISKPNAILKITVPFFASWTGFTDPTHRHFFSSHSFDYFIKDRSLARYRYSDCYFKIKRVDYLKICSGKLKLLDRIVLAFANRFKDFYEQRLAFIFPCEDIYFELEVVKNTL